MPNTFLKPETISRTALGLLRRELILPRLVTRLGIEDFRGAKNDTVNVRVPARLTAREYEWRTRTNPIVLDDISETSVPVVLDSHPYSAIAITDEELTLDIADFGIQVLNPQVLAVAEELEALVAVAIEGAPYDPAQFVDYTETADGAGAAFYKALVDARKILNDAHVPAEGRFVALGSTVEAAVLKEDAFRKVNEAGSSDALREAVIGRAAGFTIIGNVQGLSPDFAVAAHRSAFAFANVAPEVPDGATAGGGMVFDGFALRWIRDYDPSYLRDRSVVSSFAGAASVNDGPDVDIDGAGPGGPVPTNQRAVKFNFTPAA